MDILPGTLAAYAVVSLLVSVVPGPAVLLVTSQAALRGPRAGIASALGIETANLIFFTLSGLGLAAVVAASGLAFMIIKWAGAAYLAWLGISALIASFRKRPEAAAGQPAPQGSTNAFRDGLLVGLGNPKAILFVVALLPQFIDPAEPALAQTLMLCVVSCSIDFATLCAYAFAGGLMKRALGRPAVRRWFERGVGGAFLGLSAIAALYRRAV